MMNTNDPNPTPGPSPDLTQTDLSTALKDLNLAVQFLREVMKSSRQDWDMAESDTWIVQVRASWGASLLSIDSFVSAVERKMAALNEAMLPTTGS